MTIDAANPDRNCIAPGLRTDVIFDVLNHPRRREALYYLSDHVGAVPLSELSAALSHREDDPTPERRQRIATGLYHTHVPKLRSARVATYDSRTDTVTLLPEAAAALAPYLDLAARDDARSSR